MPQQPLLFDFAEKNIPETLERLESLITDNPWLIPVLDFSREWFNSKVQFTFRTSGTTGISKEYIVDRKQIKASVSNTAAFFNLKKGDNIFICLNTAFTGGKMMLARALDIGMKIFIVPPSNLPYTNANEHFYKLTAFVPSQLFTMFNTPEYDQYLGQFRNILVGGAAVNQNIKNKCKGIRYCNIYETFGMTETLSHIALKKISGVYQEQPFEALPDVEIDSDENDCLRIKAAVTGDIWLETKDVVEMPKDNQFYWRGRFDNIINSGGIKINPEEIEKAIFPVLNSSGFENFFITSKSDEKFGQKLILVIEGVETTESILAKLKSFLPENHSPSGIIWQTEIKRTSSGKILRTI